MSKIRMEDVVLPPAPRELVRRRQGILGQLTVATAVAGVTFATVATITLSMAVRAIQSGAIAGGLLWLVVLVAAYLSIGVALCAAFMNQLTFWGGAPLGDVVEAKMGFCRTWPFAATRLLAKLLFHRLTGGGVERAPVRWV